MKNSPLQKIYSPLSKWARTLQLVLAVLRKHRLRTVLATLGVFLGALLLTCILHVLAGVTANIELEAKRLGSHTMTLAPVNVQFNRKDAPLRGTITTFEKPAGSTQGSESGMPNSPEQIPDAETTSQNEAESESSGDIARKQAKTAATLTLDDVSAIRSGFPRILRAAPYILSSCQVSPFLLPGDADRLESATSSCQVYATTPEYVQVKHASPQYGRFLRNEEDTDKVLVCVLGHSLAERLFGKAKNAVGATVRLMESPLRVVGVMEKRGLDAFGTRLDEMIFVPLRTYRLRLTGQDHLSGANFTLADRQDLDGLRTGVTALLRRAHHLPDFWPDDFSISFGDHVDSFVGNALRLMRALGFVGAGISFAIGTLGILSIMTLLVSSRRVEIGIRRAVGATRRNIVLQFVSEAAVMAFAGGFLGVIVGLIPVALLVELGVFPPCYDPRVICSVFALSAGCGLIAGAYPAWQAAKTEVLQALHQE